jgi:Cation/multidrug efflux pump
VVKTLLEAILLVFLVMYLFLQNFRATLIPTIAVPVVLMGTFATLYAFGYSINTLTMFAMVLAIGLLVDDAIVVVENVERIMSEEGLTPRQATRKSMGQIQGALVGLRWCSQRYSSRWRFSAAPRGPSTVSSRLRLSRQWCFRCWWR